MNKLDILILLTSISITPFSIFMSIVSHGSILPTLTKHETWTIEYSPMIFTSLVGIYFSVVRYNKSSNNLVFIVTGVFNFILLLFFTYTMLFLWGEKY